MKKYALTENFVFLLVIRKLLEHVQRLAHQTLADHAQHLGALEDLTPDVEREVFGVHLLVRRKTNITTRRKKKEVKLQKFMAVYWKIDQDTLYPKQIQRYIPVLL